MALNYLSWDRDFVLSLLECKDYRSFLELFFDEKGSPRKLPKVSSYAEFARRAGFKSRAYVRDIVVGNKSVLASNIDQIAQAMGLSGPLKEYFRVLVAVENENIPKKSPRLGGGQNPKELLSKLRGNTLKRLEVKNLYELEAKKSSYFDVIPTIFAACGTTEDGADLERLLLRTKLPQSKLMPAVGEMIRFGLLSVVGERYFPCAAHLAVDRLGGDVYFKADFLRSLQLTKQRLAFQAKSPASLFFSSTFSVHAKDLPQLRESLRQLLLEYVNTAENQQGDCVAEVVLGFTSNS